MVSGPSSARTAPVPSPWGRDRAGGEFSRHHLCLRAAVFALSRAAIFPQPLDNARGAQDAERRAVTGSALGLAVMMVVWFVMGGERAAPVIGGVLLNMAVFGAMFSYLLQGLTFIRLRRRFPNIERPYRSPFDVLGAALTVVIALVTIGVQLADPLYRTGVLGVVW